MKHSARWIALGVLVIVAALAVALASQVGSDPRQDATKSRLVGKRTPEFSVRSLDGQAVTAASLAGKSVIVNFWNSWCPPCREELPALKQFYEKHADDPDLVMLGIVRDDTKRAITASVRDDEIGWTVAMDPGAEAALAFGTRGQPETFAISPDGVIVGAQLAAVSVRSLELMLGAARGTGS